VARKKLTFHEWARKFGDTWWRGAMKAAGYSNESRVPEEVYKEATGRGRVAPPPMPKPEEKREVKNADNGQRA